MNQNTPNPRLALRWPHPCNSTHWMGREGVPECQPSTTGVLDAQVWLLTRDRDERSHPLLKALCLILEESAWQRLKKRQRQNNKLRAHKGWRNQKDSAEMLSTLCEFYTFKCGSGDPPCFGGWPLINLIPFIITFDC